MTKVPLHLQQGTHGLLIIAVHSAYCIFQKKHVRAHYLIFAPQSEIDL